MEKNVFHEHIGKKNIMYAKYVYVPLDEKKLEQEKELNNHRLRGVRAVGGHVSTARYTPHSQHEIPELQSRIFPALQTSSRTLAPLCGRGVYF